MAFGPLTQLVLENAPVDEIETVAALCHSVGLPITLAQLDIKGDIPTEMRLVAEAACAEGETIHNMPGGVDSDQVYAALLVADQYGQRFLRGINQSKTPGVSRVFFDSSAGRSRLCPSSLDTDHRQRQYYQRNATTFHLSWIFSVVATRKIARHRPVRPAYSDRYTLPVNYLSEKPQTPGQRRCKDCAVVRAQKTSAASLPPRCGTSQATTLITTAAYSICHVVSASKSTCGYRVYIRFATIAPPQLTPERIASKALFREVKSSCQG